MLVFSAKYPVQWVAPKEEPAMYLGDSLYPKPGYQTSKMLIPRQFVSTVTNPGLGNLSTKNRLRDRFLGQNLDRLLDRDF